MIILYKYFQPEIDYLVRTFKQIFPNNNFSSDEIKDALVELAAFLEVRRTYKLTSHKLSREDKQLLQKAKQKTAQSKPKLKPIVNHVVSLFFKNDPKYDLFIDRFQLLCVGAMAKGLGTAASIDNFGSDPGQKGSTIKEFHRLNQKRLTTTPATLTSLSTHDTAKSEDVRARLDILTELPEIWQDKIRKWSRANEHLKSSNLPDLNTEYIYYLELVGSWPISLERILFQVKKAVYDAQITKGWILKAENVQHLETFIINSYNNPGFINDVAQFVQEIKTPGYINSLSQTLLKLTAPGIPDTYQGTELWDFSLSDPDNRRPVDFESRQQVLNDLNSLSPTQILAQMESGLPKLYTVTSVLNWRKAHPDFYKWKYKPLYAKGKKANHIIAFIRDNKAIAIVPRLTVLLQNDWSNTTIQIPKGNWKNIFTNETVVGKKHLVKDILQQFPVALLTKD